MIEEEALMYRLQLLENLVESQDKTLKLDNQLISMKSRLLELSEERIRLYERENLTLKIICTVALVTLSIVFIVLGILVTP